jgi:hypothetical protein
MVVEQVRENLIALKKGAKISQITVSRIVKNPRNGGDVFVSMTANYGHGGDSISEEMLSLQDAKVASLLLGKEVNVLAHEQASASGLLSEDQMRQATKRISNNFNQIIKEKYVERG